MRDHGCPAQRPNRSCITNRNEPAVGLCLPGSLPCCLLHRAHPSCRSSPHTPPGPQGTSSMAINGGWSLAPFTTAIPILGSNGGGKRSGHNSPVVIQPSCEAALCQASPHWTALLPAASRRAGLPGLLRQGQVFRGRESGFPYYRGAGLYGQEFPPLVPDWSFLMQMKTPNLHNMIGPKGTVVIGQIQSRL